MSSDNVAAFAGDQAEFYDRRLVPLKFSASAKIGGSREGAAPRSGNGSRPGGGYPPRGYFRSR